ncbi:MAG: class I SAM-dependent methyltransferase, partial [Saprospiraceae bacterium]
PSSKITLLQRGFRVTSLDGSQNMLEKAQENAQAKQVSLNVVHANWLELPTDLHGQFDAIICLGNSFTHLLTAAEQEQTIQNFHRALRKGGHLILDARNYDYVMSPRYQPKGKLYYTGNQFKVVPVEQTAQMIRLQYTNQAKQTFQLTLNPVSALRITSPTVTLGKSNGYTCKRTRSPMPA